MHHLVLFWQQQKGEKSYQSMNNHGLRGLLAILRQYQQYFGHIRTISFRATFDGALGQLVTVNLNSNRRFRLPPKNSFK